MGGERPASSRRDGLPRVSVRRQRPVLGQPRGRRDLSRLVREKNSGVVQGKEDAEAVPEVETRCLADTGAVEESACCDSRAAGFERERSQNTERLEEILVQESLSVLQELDRFSTAGDACDAASVDKPGGGSASGSGCRFARLLQAWGVDLSSPHLLQDLHAPPRDRHLQLCPSGLR